MRVAVCALVAVLGASGCCDEMGHARSLAGDGAVDCGYAVSLEERAAVIDCAEAAQAAERAFYAGWDQAGRDSIIHRYRALDADGVGWMLSVDTYQDGSPLVGNRCSSEFVRTPAASAIFGESFDCMTTTDSFTVCDD